jgi:hypothetical protein
MASTPLSLMSKRHNQKASQKPKRYRTPSSLVAEARTLRLNKTFDELKSIHSKSLTTTDYLKSCKSTQSLMAMVESKELFGLQPSWPRAFYSSGKSKGQIIPPPEPLLIEHPGFILTETKESNIYRDTFRNLFGDKHYKFRLSTALNMSSSGAGIVNSTISNSVLTSQADFVSLSTVFNEFFVVQFEVKWMPNSRYQYPLGGTSTLSIANLPIGKADLQHGQAAYSSLSAMSDNFAVGYHSTGDPFTEKWVNTEKHNIETTVVSLTAPTQSWCTVNNVSNYQGTLQFLSQSAPPALPFSQVLGTFMCHWDVLFRCRA